MDSLPLYIELALQPEDRPACVRGEKLERSWMHRQQLRHALHERVRRGAETFGDIYRHRLYRLYLLTAALFSPSQIADLLGVPRAAVPLHQQRLARLESENRTAFQLCFHGRCRIEDQLISQALKEPLASRHHQMYRDFDRTDPQAVLDIRDTLIAWNFD